MGHWFPSRLRRRRRWVGPSLFDEPFCLLSLVFRPDKGGDTCSVPVENGIRAGTTTLFCVSDSLNVSCLSMTPTLRVPSPRPSKPQTAPGSEARVIPQDSGPGVGQFLVFTHPGQGVLGAIPGIRVGPPVSGTLDW